MLNAPSTIELLPAVVDIARQAAQAVMEVYDSKGFGIHFKQDNSPVTAADLAANTIIISRLAQLTPTIPIVSEETLIPDKERLASPAIWLVDPVDGTKEFIKHNGEFTVNIALINNGEPVLGAVAVPATGTMFYGAKRQGAYKQIGAKAPERLRTQPNRQEPVVAISSSHPSDLTAAWMNCHGLTQTKCVGSSLKICYVADHTVDVYPRLSPQSEWDIAAGDAILRAAGGQLTVYQTGEPMTYNKPQLETPFYIAGNGLADQATYHESLAA